MRTRNFEVPAWHHETIAAEHAGAEPKDRMLRVIRSMPDQEGPDFSSVDWDAEVAGFGEIDFPAYYLQPFHSVPGGYLSTLAAGGDRQAMEAIYQDYHERRSLGIRDELASLVPDDARRVVDLGAGTGDAAAAIARRLPKAHITAIEASPFMLIAAKHQNGTPGNVSWTQGFAEATGLGAASVDAVTITLVFHECPDTIKADILREAHRILRPGGSVILSDTPNDDLHNYRGFYEPYKEQWLEYDPDAALAQAGFEAVEAHDVAPPLWTRIARRPA